MTVDKWLAQMPDSLQSKIMTYFFSYGTAIANVVKQIAKDSINECITTLWFAKIHAGDARIMSHYTDCPFDIMCDLRLAVIEHYETELMQQLGLVQTVKIVNSRNIVQHFLKIFTDYRLDRLMTEIKNNNTL